jgi:hypothetical protein
MELTLIRKLEASRWDASGGRKSKGRDVLLGILRTRTEADVAQELGCSREFVSLVSSGKKRPGRWLLVERFRVKLGIEPGWWDRTV